MSRYSAIFGAFFYFLFLLLCSPPLFCHSVFSLFRHSERGLSPEESRNHGRLNMDSSVVVLPQNDNKDTNFPVITFF